jgi:hypothetical protein
MDDDKTHGCWTYAVVYVDRMHRRSSALDATETVIAARHWHTMTAGLSAAVRHATLGWQSEAVSNHIRIVEIPPGEPHDFDGNVIADVRIGRGL